MAKPKPPKSNLLLELHKQLAATKELVHAATRQMNIDMAKMTQRLGWLEGCATAVPAMMARLVALETRVQTCKTQEAKRAAKTLKRKRNTKR